MPDMATPVKVAPTTRKGLERMDEYIGDALEELQEVRGWVQAQRGRTEFSAADKARLGQLSDYVAGVALALAQLSRLAHEVKSGEWRE